MEALVHTLVEKSKFKSPYVVGISGIDGAGKGYIGAQLCEQIRARGVRCELIGIDGWLAEPEQRFSDEDPGLHFLNHGIRFDEFERLLFRPLSVTGEIDLVAQHSGPSHEAGLEDFHYDLEDVEVILFEGIFLFQERFEFDYRVWIDCTYQTALHRAIERSQEGVSEEQLRKDCETIYFAAQRFHQKRDKPREVCDLIYPNDMSLQKLSH